MNSLCLILLGLVLAMSSASCSSTRSEESLLREEALLNRGHHLYQEKNWPHSLRVLDQVLALNPENIKAQVLREMVRFESGEKEDSVNRLNAVCETIPNQKSCLVSLGHLHFKSQNWAASRQAWSRAVQDPKLPNRPAVFYYLAAAQLKQGEAIEAESLWRKSLNQPSTAENCRVRQLGSRILLQQARFREAIAEARIANSLCEGDFESYQWLGYALYKSARFTEAESVFRKSLSIFRDPVNRSYSVEQLNRLKNQEVLDEPDFLL